MIYDIITINNEFELFDIRYNVLKDYVNEFRVVEFDQTFSGKPKEFTFPEIHYKYDKVKYYPVSYDVWSKYEDLAKSSPNTQYGKGAEHWVREFCQKESIRDCLTDLEDDDVVFIGDCDEIWQTGRFFHTPSKLKLKVYSYWLNNKSNEEFWGTLVASYKDIKDQCLNHLRTNVLKTKDYAGWHFTSMGGHENVKKKLTDSYTQESYITPQVLNNLEHNILESKDFLGRDFTYKIDEEDWPTYLKENRDKYKHLCK